MTISINSGEEREEMSHKKGKMPPQFMKGAEKRKGQMDAMKKSIKKNCK